jgi:hypothetical protein
MIYLCDKIITILDELFKKDIYEKQNLAIGHTYGDA